MIYEYEDLPQHGVILIPPTSPEYDPLLEDIRRRYENPVEGSLVLPPNTPPEMRSRLRPEIRPEDRPFSAVLVNRSQHGIVLIDQIWTVLEESGRTRKMQFGSGLNPSVLLPFGLPECQIKLYRYWHVILPGSKRYLTMRGDRIGDNSDVRPPAPDEYWKGGGIGGGGSFREDTAGPVAKLTLSLDGVFFDNGGFAGPNRTMMWEQVVRAAELPVQVAQIARESKEAGLSPDEIYSRIEEVVGPPRERSGLRPSGDRMARSQDRVVDRVNRMVQGARSYGPSEEETLARIISWADAPLPRFHKL